MTHFYYYLLSSTALKICPETIADGDSIILINKSFLILFNIKLLILITS